MCVTATHVRGFVISQASPQSQPVARVVHPFHSLPTTTTTTTSTGLFSQRNNITNSESLEDLVTIHTPLLIADIFSIVLATQLLGLADTLNDPNFWDDGGWFQPVTMRSTYIFPTLIQRFSILAISWFTAAFAKKGWTSDATTEPFKAALALVFPFVIVLGVLETLASFILQGEFPPDLLEIIRMGYFTLILVLAGRFAFSKSPYA